VVPCGHAVVAQTPPKKVPEISAWIAFQRRFRLQAVSVLRLRRLNGQKVRQSSETTDRREAAQKLLEMEAEAKAPARYTVSEAVNRFVTELEGSGYAPKSVQRYKYSLKRLTDFLTAFQRRARNVLPCLQGTRNLRFGQGSI